MSLKGQHLIFITLILSAYCQADWMTDANSRIEQYRKRNGQITVLGASGQYVADVNVQIEQTKHNFAFGSAYNYNSLYNNATYRNFILNHFEYGVCENETKWTANEPSQGYVTYTQGDYIYNWCNSNGIKMRGHNIFWEQQTALPSWVPGLAYAPWPQASDLYTACQNRLNSVVPHYQNKFFCWDVDNEMLGTGSGYQFFNRLEVRPSDINSRIWMYQRANQLDPNCKLVVNEFTGNSFGSYNSYAQAGLITTMRNKGAPVHTVGMQAHINSPFDPVNYWNNVLTPLHSLNLPIWATEFDSDTTSDPCRAADVENFFRIMYSDPCTAGIIMWGFMVGTTWRSNGAWGIVNSGGTLNAAGHIYEDLIDEWTTLDANYTDVNGGVRFRGYHGTYQITLYKAGQTEVHTIELTPGSTTQQFIIDTNFTGGAPDTNAPTPNPMTWASAPTATSPYAITMTATTATDNETPPVQYYFNCTTDPNKDSGWQSSTTYTASGLTPSTSYSFRVKARDSSSSHNETAFSNTLSATTDPPDTTPPSPNPPTWVIAPTAIGEGSITMKASTEIDSNNMPVQYYFGCITDSNKSSGWQSSSTYLAVGLNSNTQYTFRVKARDSSPALNETAWSSQQSATTAQSSIYIDPISVWVDGTINAKVSGTDRGLIFIAHGQSSIASLNIQSATYGAQPMTKILENSYFTGTDYVYTGAFILLDSGIAISYGGNFVPTWNILPDNAGYSSIFLSHVDQLTPIVDSDSNGTTQATALTKSLTTNYGDMVIEAATSDSAGSYTLNNGFNEGLNRTIDSNITGVTGYKSGTGASETPNVTYNGSQGGQSLIGFVVRAGTGNLAPAAPKNLTATAGMDYASLDWDDNNEVDLAGYNVYISTTKGSGYSKVNGNIVHESDYVQGSLINGTIYYFVVTAVDSAGLESTFSNEAAVRAGYQTCQQVLNDGYAIWSDLNGDCYVDFKDLEIIVQNWLSSGCNYTNNFCNGADLDGSGAVDFIDISYLALDWTNCNNPPDFNCPANW